MSVKSGTLRCPKCGEDVINDYDHWQKKEINGYFIIVVLMMAGNGLTGMVIIMALLIVEVLNNVGKNMVDQLLMIGMKDAKINGPEINVKKQENHFWNLLKKNKY